jgi:type II secretory pathway pseudopilin PulG
MSLIEVLVVVAIIGALAALAVPSIAKMMEARKMRGFAREAANVFEIARSQAVRTGNYQIVFFGPPGTTDPAGTAIESGGQAVPMLILDDGTPATANCHIDNGENIEALRARDAIGWGVTDASTKPPDDKGVVTFTPPHNSGATFADAAGTARNWVIFRPDGVPVGAAATSTTCGTVGDTGTGAGALYFTNGERDYAVTLSPLGAVSIHSWNGVGWK